MAQLQIIPSLWRFMGSASGIKSICIFGGIMEEALLCVPIHLDIGGSVFCSCSVIIGFYSLQSLGSICSTAEEISNSMSSKYLQSNITEPLHDICFLFLV